MIRGVEDTGAGTDSRWDFFVSYTAVDLAWAEWVAWQLEDAGYRVLIQTWDFVPGSNWQRRMQEGVRLSARTIALLSQAYLASVYGEQEWQAAQASDPQGFERKLLPIRIEECPRPGLLGSVVSIDLFDLDHARAKDYLLDRIRQALEGRAKPNSPPDFPMSSSSPEHPAMSSPARAEPPPSPTTQRTESSRPTSSDTAKQGAPSRTRTVSGLGPAVNVTRRPPVEMLERAAQARDRGEATLAWEILRTYALTGPAAEIPEVLDRLRREQNIGDAWLVIRTIATEGSVSRVREIVGELVRANRRGDADLILFASADRLGDGLSVRPAEREVKP